MHVSILRRRDRRPSFGNDWGMSLFSPKDTQNGMVKKLYQPGNIPISGTEEFQCHRKEKGMGG